MSRRGKVRRRRPSPADGFVTPPKGIVQVDVERIQSALLQLTINTGTDSPRSTKSGQLQKRRLFQLPVPWSVSEEHALVCFILLHSDGKSWVSRRSDESFWNRAADYICTRLNSPHLRTGLL